MVSSGLIAMRCRQRCTTNVVTTNDARQLYNKMTLKRVRKSIYYKTKKGGCDAMRTHAQVRRTDRRGEFRNSCSSADNPSEIKVYLKHKLFTTCNSTSGGDTRITLPELLCDINDSELGQLLTFEVTGD